MGNSVGRMIEKQLKINTVHQIIISDCDGQVKVWLQPPLHTCPPSALINVIPLLTHEQIVRSRGCYQMKHMVQRCQTNAHRKLEQGEKERAQEAGDRSVGGRLWQQAYPSIQIMQAVGSSTCEREKGVM